MTNQPSGATGEFRRYSPTELRRRTPDSPPLEDRRGDVWYPQHEHSDRWGWYTKYPGWVGMYLSNSRLARRLLREVTP